MSDNASKIDEESLEMAKGIWAAVWHNDIDTLRRLLHTSSLEAINHKNETSRTALHTAALNINVDCARLLIDHGADVDVENKDRMTALHFAAYSPSSGDSNYRPLRNKKRHKEIRMKQLEMVRLLISVGANPFRVTVRGETPETLAIENDLPEMVHFLREESLKYRNRELEEEHRKNYENLRDAILKEDLGHFIDVLRKDPKCLNKRCPDTGQTLLYLASSIGALPIVEYILSKVGGNLDIPEGQAASKTLTPLHIACQKGYTPIVKLLMGKQPSYVAYFDADGRTPLHDACKFGYLDIVHYLLCCSSPIESGGQRDLLDTVTVPGELHTKAPSSIEKYLNPINVDKRQRRSSLHDAAESGNLEVVRLLLMFLEKGTVRGVDTTSGELSYKSRLPSLTLEQPHPQGPKRSDNLTSSTGRRSIAGIDSVSRSGYTPFHLAARKHHYSVCDELLAAGAHLNAIIRPDLNKEIDVDYTLLVAAAHSNDLELVKFLLSRGATDERNRALRRTLRNDHTEAAGLLLSYSTGVQISPNDQTSDYHTSEKESHLLDIVWQHRELTKLHPDWIQTVLRENLKPAISSVLIKLDVSRNKLTSLPFQIFQLSNLIEIDVSNNQLTLLPSSPPPLHNSMCQEGTDLDEVSWSCTRLRKLNASHNLLTELPGHIFSLPSLEELRATHNNISMVSVSMWCSPGLSHIYLDNNKISQLPNPTPLNLSEESNLDNSVRGDKVLLSPSSKTTPVHTLQHTNSLTTSGLTSFSDSYNSYLPPVHIENTRFRPNTTDRWMSTLAAPIKGQLFGTLDKKINMRREQSRKSTLEDPDSSELDIPQKSRGAKESCLTTLSLNYNYLICLPPALACYAPTLKKLYIAHNQLKQLGVVHDFPPNLEILDASSNQLTECISTSLTSSAYKDQACYSPHSQTVTVLDDQELVCPHRFHKTLRKLSTLRLAKNNLTSITLFRMPIKQNVSGIDRSQEDPTETASIPRDSYSIGTIGNYNKNSHGSGSSENSGHGFHSQLKNSKDSGFSVSTSVTRELTHKDQKESTTEVAPPLYPELSNLDISNNKLSDIPKEISQIHTLGSLNVSHNEMVENLPLELSRLENLFQLDYSGLDLVRPTVADLDKYHRTTDKLNYMRALLDSSAKNYKMKLMMVGLQRQGKTTLLTKLREVSEKGSTFNPAWGERTNSLNYSQCSQDSSPPQPKEQLSTVGVDLGEWKYSKDLADNHFGAIKNKLKSPKGNPTITFYTWDFAGQEEYYATHQCFLTYRSLYLLLWNASKDREGIKNLAFWLHNIQSRAPGSPVIIIGSHADLLGYTQQDREEKKLRLETYIREQYLVDRPLHELEEHGLPVVKGVYFVAMPSNGRSEGIHELRRSIYDIAMALSPNERKGRSGKSGGQTLLDQPVPAKYIKLEESIHQIRKECKGISRTPVMNAQEFREHTRGIISEPADLQYAVTYLHENGVLLHYNTPILEHLYFIDPQWLVDMLAHIVTVAEVNRYIKRDCQQSGILSVSNMAQIFKGQVFPSTYQSEYVELLGRFEVALALDSEKLLIPSFLPDTPTYTIHWYRTKFPRPLIKDVIQEYLMDKPWSIPSISSNDHQSGSSPVFDQSYTAGIHEHSSQRGDSGVRLKYTGLLLRRFYFMLYMPSGFWPRLISRMMSNNSILELIRELLGQSLEDSEEDVSPTTRYKSGSAKSFMTVFEHSKLNWSYWKTGIELWIEGKSVIRISEIMGTDFYSRCSGSPYEAYEDTSDKSKMTTRKYPDIQTQSLNPNGQQHFKTGVGPIDPYADTNMIIFAFNGAYQSVNALKRRGLEILIPDIISLNSVTSLEKSWTSAKLLARVVDFIDALLEDWFPGLGARNILPDEGIPKVVRLVPCPLCIGMGQGSHSDNKSRCGKSAIRKKESNPSKRGFSIKDDRVNASVMISQALLNTYAFLVEELVFSSKESHFIDCANHNKVNIADIAPDLMFADIQYMVLDSNCVDRNVYIDSGGFGDIFSGKLFRNPNGSECTTGDQGEEIAIKVQANSEKRGDSRTDDKHVSMAGYLSMRAELSILESLSHPHIIKVLGLLLNPYSMLVEWAPLGSLHAIVTSYWENNLSIQPHVLHKVICQVAEGIAYLHKKEIIYYDLKSPNILAFEFPTIQYLKGSYNKRDDMNMNALNDEKIVVNVKVADMGISRYSVLGKSKGFRGTPGFMAPEILKFHGTETCDSKVDIFSMGMFMYELIAGHFPYEYQNLMDGQIEKLIVSRERPSLQKREVTNPFFFLSCMRWCWEDDPRFRPTAPKLVEVLNKDSLPRLIDSFPLGISNPVSAVCLCVLPQTPHSQSLNSLDMSSDHRSPERKSSSSYSTMETREELWICFKDERMGQATVVSFQEHPYLNIETVPLCPSRVKCLCAVKDTVWACSEGGELFVYQASTHKQLFQRPLILAGQEEEGENEITSIVYYPELCTVVVSTFSGTILCFEDQPSEIEEWDYKGYVDQRKCYLPVKHTVKLTHSINTIIAIPTNEEDTFQVWCGCLKSTVAVMNVKNYTFSHPEYLKAPFSQEDQTEHGYIHHLAHTLSYNRYHQIWSLLNPSSILQCWDAEKREPIPGREFRFCDHKEDPVQSMIAFEEFIYLGTLKGMIYIFNTELCRIKCELEGHDRTVYSLTRMNGIVQPGYWMPRILGKTLPSRQRESNHKKFDRLHRHRPVIVSIGTGFKDLAEQPISSIEVDSKDTFMLAWLAEYSIGMD
ncbi:Leucine-rich repeat serine/threonine-protein kinase 1-like [Oopsacas minuta]|uniref:non-specific serine/threonine protein kinase n=1 Tax=Oopsacas minuta TaxID=111878 RepID=A0AAV7JDB2_9METZ|nr:Leucine-rich repeat serine/threonine-protein kinase 1-like [Oopsacas minuta]